MTAGAAALLITIGGLTACSSGGTDASRVAATSAGSDTTSDTPSSSPTTPPPVVLTEHVGQSSDQASAELTQQGLQVVFADAAGHILPGESGWTVTSEQPSAGVSVAPGSVVQLVLSPPIVATDHVGETAEQATSELAQQGIVVSYADTSGNTLPGEQGWSVVGQNPAAGSALHAGSTVQLILTPPPPPAAPPEPEAPTVQPGGPTAKCNDGTLSYSAHHQGTCSHHGGVAVWYK